MRNRFVWLLLSLFMLSFVGATSPPSIAIQPQSATNIVGTSVTFSVAAVGEELTYQWQRNGVDVPNATQPAFTIPATQLSDSGSSFQVRVGNDKGSVTSCMALLTVLESGTPSTSPPVCPQPQASGGSGGGGCGGGGGGGGGGGSSGDGTSSGDPPNDLPDFARPFPVTRWKGSVKATQDFSHATSGDHHTLVVEGDVTFESSANELGVHPTTITTVAGSLSLRRQGVGGGCNDLVTATGEVRVYDGMLVFTPNPQPPQRPTELSYEGGGETTMTGTQVRSCPGGGGTSQEWTSRARWMAILEPRMVSPDMLVISGTYVHDQSMPGMTMKTTYEWHLVKQP